MKLLPHFIRQIFQPLHVVLLFMTMPLPSLAQGDPPCWSAKSAEEYENCLSTELFQRAKELENLYEKALMRLAKDGPVPSVGYFPEHVKSALVQAHDSWKKFVETDCEAVFARTYPGRAAFTEQNRCRIAHTKRRIQDLQEWQY